MVLFDANKEGIKQRTSKQNTDVLAILKRQYEQALLSAMQNVQLTPTVETFELRNCTVDPAYRSPLCYDEYLESSVTPIIWSRRPLTRQRLQGE